MLKLFTDDVMLYSNINIASDSLTLQQSLDGLANWVNEWQLSININVISSLCLTSQSLPCILTMSMAQLSLAIVLTQTLELLLVVI